MLCYANIQENQTNGHKSPFWASLLYRNPEPLQYVSYDKKPKFYPFLIFAVVKTV